MTYFHSAAHVEIEKEIVLPGDKAKTFLGKKIHRNTAAYSREITSVLTDSLGYSSHCALLSSSVLSVDLLPGKAGCMNAHWIPFLARILGNMDSAIGFPGL